MLKKHLMKICWLALRKIWYVALGRRYIIKKRLGGFLLLDMLNYVDRHTEAFGTYEKKQNEILLNFLYGQHCEAFFDIGACWGYYSILIGIDKRLESTQIYAFEPDERNLYQLYANIFLNNLSERISVFPKGVSNRSGTLGFSRHNEENRGRSAISAMGASKIEVCTIDDTFTFANKTVAVKIDVEGHELNVLQGMSNMLTKNNCILQIEAFEESAAAIENFMRHHSYKLVCKVEADHFFVKSLNNQHAGHKS